MQINNIRTIAFTVFCSLLTVSSAIAETQWVDDEIYLPLRNGQGNQFKILHRGLKSGTALEVLEKPNGDWYKVRTSNGKEGWVRTQYLSSTPTASIQLAESNRQLAKLKKQLEEAKSTLSSDQLLTTNLREQLTEQTELAERLSAELEELKRISSGAVEINERYQSLTKNHQLIQTEVDSLTADNERLRNDVASRYMIYGAGSVLLGVLIAIILPRIRPKKRYSEWA